MELVLTILITDAVEGVPTSCIYRVQTWRWQTVSTGRVTVTWPTEGLPVLVMTPKNRADGAFSGVLATDGRFAYRPNG